MTKYLPASLLLFLVIFAQLAAQEPVPEPVAEPMPMVDPLRPQRVELRDAWRHAAEASFAAPQPQAKLRAAWCLFHQFDVDYFTLLEGDGEELLLEYQRRCQAWRKELAAQAEDEVIRLTMQELSALLDDIAANRLQFTRPEPGDAGFAAWNEKYVRFQTKRATAMQERGKRVVELYRSGDADALRVCVALLDRQIAERVLEEQQSAAGDEPIAADKLAERAQALFEKQQGEWDQMRTLLGEADAALSAKDIGAQVCDLQHVALEVVRAKRLAREAEGSGEDAELKAAQERVAQAAQRLFTAHQELHRAAAKQNIEAALTTEQFARVHDLRMYTTLWHDGTVPAADVVADAIEVAETWAKLHDRLEKSAPESIEARLALAKKLETAIAREELKPR